MNATPAPVQTDPQAAEEQLREQIKRIQARFRENLRRMREQRRSTQPPKQGTTHDRL